MLSAALGRRKHGTRPGRRSFLRRCEVRGVRVTFPRLPALRFIAVRNRPFCPCRGEGAGKAGRPRRQSQTHALRRAKNGCGLLLALGGCVTTKEGTARF